MRHEKHQCRNEMEEDSKSMGVYNSALGVAMEHGEYEMRKLAMELLKALKEDHRECEDSRCDWFELFRDAEAMLGKG